MNNTDNLKQAYKKSLLKYRLSRNGSPYVSGYVIAEILASKVTDTGFYNNPNLLTQYMPDLSNIQSSGSKLFDSVAGAVAETYEEKKAQEKIDKAETETSAKLVIYAVDRDPEHIKMDLVFYNRSKNREMNNPGFQIDPTYSESEIVKVTHSHRSGNHFEDVLTMSFPFDWLFEIRGREALVWFDTEDEDDSNDVFLQFIINYELQDLLCVDYLVRGDKWDQSKKDIYENLIDRRASLAKDNEAISVVEQNNADLENKYTKKGAGFGCLTAILLGLIPSIIIANISYDEPVWPIFVGLAIGIGVFIYFRKQGQKATKDSRLDSAYKAAALKRDLSGLCKEFDAAYSKSVEQK